MFDTFDTFDRTDKWRAARFANRLIHGFPDIQAFFDAGTLRSVVDGPGMVTTLSSAAWAGVLRATGMPAAPALDKDSSSAPTWRMSCRG